MTEQLSEIKRDIFSPLTEDLAVKLKRLVDLGVTGSLPTPTGWPPFDLIHPDRQSKFVLALRLLQTCFTPELGTWKLTFETAPERAFEVFLPGHRREFEHVIEEERAKQEAQEQEDQPKAKIEETYFALSREDFIGQVPRQYKEAASQVEENRSPENEEDCQHSV